MALLALRVVLTSGNVTQHFDLIRLLLGWRNWYMQFQESLVILAEEGGCLLGPIELTSECNACPLQYPGLGICQNTIGIS